MKVLYIYNMCHHYKLVICYPPPRDEFSENCQNDLIVIFKKTFEDQFKIEMCAKCLQLTNNIKADFAQTAGSNNTYHLVRLEGLNGLPTTRHVKLAPMRCRGGRAERRASAESAVSAGRSRITHLIYMHWEKKGIIANRGRPATTRVKNASQIGHKVNSTHASKWNTAFATTLAFSLLIYNLKGKIRGNSVPAKWRHPAWLPIAPAWIWLQWWAATTAASFWTVVGHPVLGGSGRDDSSKVSQGSVATAREKKKIWTPQNTIT